MGLILEQTKAMSPYEVEVRRESFYLHSNDTRHNIIVYPGASGSGTVEILLEDIPKIRAAFDAIENYVRSRK